MPTLKNDSVGQGQMERRHESVFGYRLYPVFSWMIGQLGHRSLWGPPLIVATVTSLR